MVLQDYEKQLIKMYREVKELYVSDRAIERIATLVNEAFNIAEKHNLSHFKNNVRQTRDKQLAMLLMYKDRPKLRIQRWDETKNNFIQDFEEYLGHEKLSQNIE